MNKIDDDGMGKMFLKRLWLVRITKKNPEKVKIQEEVCVKS